MSYTTLVTRLKAPRLGVVKLDRLQYDDNGDATVIDGGAFPAKQIVLDSVQTPALLASVLWEIAHSEGLVDTVLVPDTYQILSAGNSLFFLNKALDRFEVSFQWEGGGL